jgi:hypothetical protein
MGRAQKRRPENNSNEVIDEVASEQPVNIIEHSRDGILVVLRIVPVRAGSAASFTPIPDNAAQYKNQTPGRG